MSAIARPVLEQPTNVGNLWTSYVRGTVVFVLCVGLIGYLSMSWRWPIKQDVQVLHYVSLLIHHGFAPYRQIGDMNMPGAYLMEGWALKVFGSSDLGWRFYDFSLAAILISSMVVITRPYDWVAGFFAGSVFTLLHGADLAFEAGQREQVMAVCLCLGLAFCFESIRRNTPWMMFPFGLTTAMAAAIKPSVLLAGPIILLLAIVQARRKGQRTLACTLWALLGFSVSTCIVLHFLMSHDSMQAFLYDIRVVLPHYQRLDPASWRFLIVTAIPNSLLLGSFVAVIVIATRRRAMGWEGHSLLLCLFLGVVNYIAQRKGFPYHRYVTLAFGLLWLSIPLFTALRSEQRWLKWVATATVILLSVQVVPRTLLRIHSQLPYDNFSRYLESDLKQIGVDQLQGKVECLDIVDGCMTALFHLNLVQSLGSTGDLLLFLPQPSWVVDRARENFYKTIVANPPNVIILTNVVFQEKRTFDKVNVWPEFATWFSGNYRCISQREFPTLSTVTAHPGIDSDVPAYRIYVHR